MKYAIKTMNQYVGHNGHLKLYDNAEDACQAAKDAAETIRFILSAKDCKPYAVDMRMEPFEGDPTIKMPNIIINEMNLDGTVYTSVDMVRVVDGECAAKRLKEEAQMHKHAAKQFEKLMRQAQKNWH